MSSRKSSDEPVPGYRLIEPLGSGGFGEVWKVEAPGGILKAIKFVHGSVKGGSTEEDKALRELKGLHRIRDIRHPFILSMDRFEIIDDRLIIIMELADRDLTALYKEYREKKARGIPRDELIKYMFESAEALDLMNFRYELQHLDIKPSNLFLVERHIKVADFGLAKALEGCGAKLTSGMTPMYGSPETFNGQITRNTDQYSLAIVYQQLLTGKLPFNGPTPQQFMLQHLTKEPNVKPLPAAEQPVILRALAKDSTQRFASCMELVEALRDAGKQSLVVPAVAGAPALPGQPAAPKPKPKNVIGIDLGTTNSVVGIVEGTEIKIIQDQEGNRLTPSVVAFSASGEKLIGMPARRQAVTNATRTITSSKRLMGRRYEELDARQKDLPFLAPGKLKDPVRIQIDNRKVAPEEIAASLLRKLKNSAEEYLSAPVTHAVVTVPAYFNDGQRQATVDAGAIAGLEILRVLNEPTAAALAYGLEKKFGGTIAVFDLGGGTFDITILKIKNGVFDVLSTNGDTMLGGDDFDNHLVDHLVGIFKKENKGLDPFSEPSAVQRLREAAERAKMELSHQTQTEINLPFLMADATGPKHLVTQLSRLQFEQLTEHLMDRCKEPCMQALEDAKIQLSDLKEVLMVGGSSRIPKLREKVTEWFKREPSKGMNPDEAIAMGAAIQANMLSSDRDDVLLLDVLPLSLGVEVRNNFMTKVIERNTTIPTIKKEIFSTARDGQTEVGIHVLQGEREFARDNRSLGTFWLEGIRPAPAGSVQIEITFSIDANGILNVTAAELGTDNQQSIQVKSTSGLGQSDIERMRQEAEQQADNDRRRREMLEARQAASKTLDLARAFVTRNLIRFKGDEAESINKQISNLERLMSEDDPVGVGTGMWTLERLLEVTHESLNHRERARIPAPAKI